MHLVLLINQHVYRQRILHEVRFELIDCMLAVKCLCRATVCQMSVFLAVSRNLLEVW